MDGGRFGGRGKQWTYHWKFIAQLYLNFVLMFYCMRQYLEYENIFTWGKEEALAQMSAAQHQIYEQRPAWVEWIYGLAVLTGLGGAILLLLRNALAIPVFALSLAAIVIQFGYILFGMNAIATLGASSAIFPAVIALIGAALLWFSLHAKSKGWIA